MSASEHGGVAAQAQEPVYAPPLSRRAAAAPLRGEPEVAFVAAPNEGTFGLPCKGRCPAGAEGWSTRGKSQRAESPLSRRAAAAPLRGEPEVAFVAAPNEGTFGLPCKGRCPGGAEGWSTRGKNQRAESPFSRRAAAAPLRGEPRFASPMRAAPPIFQKPTHFAGSGRVRSLLFDATDVSARGKTRFWLYIRGYLVYNKFALNFKSTKRQRS